MGDSPSSSCHSPPANLLACYDEGMTNWLAGWLASRLEHGCVGTECRKEGPSAVRAGWPCPIMLSLCIFFYYSFNFLLAPTSAFSSSQSGCCSVHAHTLHHGHCALDPSAHVPLCSHPHFFCSSCTPSACPPVQCWLSSSQVDLAPRSYKTNKVSCILFLPSHHLCIYIRSPKTSL